MGHNSGEVRIPRRVMAKSTFLLTAEAFILLTFAPPAHIISSSGIGPVLLYDSAGTPYPQYAPWKSCHMSTANKIHGKKRYQDTKEKWEEIKRVVVQIP
jgi:hypothetical protein